MQVVDFVVIDVCYGEVGDGMVVIVCSGLQGVMDWGIYNGEQQMFFLKYINFIYLNNCVVYYVYDCS